MTTCPVRCYGCNKVLGNKYRTYWKMRDDKLAKYIELEADPDIAVQRAVHEAASALVKRNCCKKTLRTSRDMTHFLLRMKRPPLRNTEFKERRKGITTIVLGRGVEPDQIFQSEEIPELLPPKDASLVRKRQGGGAVGRERQARVERTHVPVESTSRDTGLEDVMGSMVIDS